MSLRSASRLSAPLSSAAATCCFHVPSIAAPAHHFSSSTVRKPLAALAPTFGTDAPPRSTSRLSVPLCSAALTYCSRVCDTRLFSSSAARDESLLAAPKSGAEIQRSITTKFSSSDTEKREPLTKQRATDIVEMLSEEEQQILMTAVQTFQSDKLKGEFQAESQPPPTSRQLAHLGVHNALPFIGFGFLDNFIMIVAGDYIDITIGMTLGISTMAAAALGNTISDVAGIGSAWYVENIVTKVGFKPPPLSPAQLDMKSSRRTANFGRAIGVSLGCLLGMIPLMFLPTKKKRGEENEEEGVVSVVSAEEAIKL